MGTVSHYLGLKFQWRETSSRTSVHISQEAFIDQLIKSAGLNLTSSTTKTTPYPSGHPVDSVSHVPMSANKETSLITALRHLVGSLLWISQGTRPDISVITSLLAQHQNNPYPGHISPTKHVVKYLKGTSTLGIAFHSDMQLTPNSFVHFPVTDNKITEHSNANWGPQDQSLPTHNNHPPLDLFKT